MIRKGNFDEWEKKREKRENSFGLDCALLYGEQLCAGSGGTDHFRK